MTESVDDNRAKPRSESELPKLAMSNKERENKEPSLDIPMTDTEEPNRRTLRTAMVAPRCASYRTAKELPSRFMPTREKAEAKRDKLLRDIDEPRLAKPNTETDDDKRAMLLIDTELPKDVNPSTDSENKEPNLASPTTETADARRA
jgi:hypothetical protein